MADQVVSEVEKALFQLYNDPVPDNKSKAEKWLTLLQESREAWVVSWQLLQHQSIEVQHFGALMLHSKITKSWPELSPDQHSTVRLELFNAILRFSNGPRLVLTRLCVAMVLFAFHALPEVWPNALVSIVQTLRGASQQGNAAVALLEYMTVLPEEFERTSTSPLASKRGTLRAEIKKVLPSVLTVIEELLSSKVNTSLQKAATQCLSSWSQFGLPFCEMHSLVAILFKCLHDPELIGDAAGTLTELVSHHDNYRYPETLKEFLKQLLTMSDFFHSKVNERDMDICVSLCQLFVATLEVNMDIMIAVSEDNAENCEEILESLHILLSFTAIPGYYPVCEKCSDITFSFWENFLDRLASEDPQHSEFLLDFYSGILTCLIEMFPIKAHYPPEEEWNEDWDEDDQDSFMKYREDLCDLGESLQRTLHIDYLKHLTSCLSSSLSDSNGLHWQDIEAILYLLQGVASNITDETSVYFRNVLSLFPQMPIHRILVKTALKLLGDLADWFSQQPDILQAVLPMILDSLTTPSLSASAALSFKYVCGECSNLLGPIAPHLVNRVQMALSDSSVDIKHCIPMIAAVGSVLSALPLSDLTTPMESLTASRVNTLQRLAAQQPSMVSHPLVLRELAILSTLCHHIYPDLQYGEQHPVVYLLMRVWSSLEALLSLWLGDPDVVDAICNGLNRAIKNTGHQYLPLLEGTIQLVVKCFTAVHYAKLLDTAVEVINQFGSADGCRAMVSHLLETLSSLCLQLCQHGLSTLDPDTIQAFLRLLSTSLKKCFEIFIGFQNLLHNTYRIGLMSLKLPEPLTVSTASELLVTMVTLTDSKQPVQQMMLENGKQMVECVLHAVGTSTPRSQLQSFVNIIYSLCVYCVTQLSQWMEEVLLQPHFPSPHTSVLEKQQFRHAILRERGNKQGMKNKVLEFYCMCRGFHGTIYAAATT